MKVILIEEARFAEFGRLLRLKADELKGSRAPERLGLSEAAWNTAVNEVFTSLRYEFVTWAKSHGASCVR